MSEIVESGTGSDSILLSSHGAHLGQFKRYVNF
jgi:hypothetical protein